MRYAHYHTLMQIHTHFWKRNNNKITAPKNIYTTAPSHVTFITDQLNIYTLTPHCNRREVLTFTHSLCNGFKTTRKINYLPFNIVSSLCMLSSHVDMLCEKWASGRGYACVCFMEWNISLNVCRVTLRCLKMTCLCHDFIIFLSFVIIHRKC